MNAPMLSIGGPTAEAVEVLGQVVLAVLGSGAEQKTLRMALEVLSKGVSAPTNTSISGCTFYNRPDAEG